MEDMKSQLDCGHESSEWWKTRDGTKCQACFDRWKAYTIPMLVEMAEKTNAYAEIIAHRNALQEKYDLEDPFPLYVVKVYKKGKIEYKEFPDFDPMHKFVNSIKESCSIFRFISHMQRELKKKCNKKN